MDDPTGALLGRDKRARGQGDTGAQEENAVTWRAEGAVGPLWRRRVCLASTARTPRGRIFLFVLLSFSRHSYKRVAIGPYFRVEKKNGVCLFVAGATRGPLGALQCVRVRGAIPRCGQGFVCVARTLIPTVTSRKSGQRTTQRDYFATDASAPHSHPCAHKRPFAALHFPCSQVPFFAFFSSYFFRPPPCLWAALCVAMYFLPSRADSSSLVLLHFLFAILSFCVLFFWIFLSAVRIWAPAASRTDTAATESNATSLADASFFLFDY